MQNIFDQSKTKNYNMQNENNPFINSTTDNGKTVAIISYLTLIGWVIAYVMYGSNKQPLSAYHIRQSLGLIITGVVFYILQFMLLFIPFIGWLISFIMIPIGLFLFVLWIIGLIAAINGEEKQVHVIGNKIQEMLSSIK